MTSLQKYKRAALWAFVFVAMTLMLPIWVGVLVSEKLGETLEEA